MRELQADLQKKNINNEDVEMDLYVAGAAPFR